MRKRQRCWRRPWGNPQTRLAAAAALVRIDPKQEGLAGIFVSLLKDADEKTRTSAVEAFGRLSAANPEARRAAAEMVEDKIKVSLKKGWNGVLLVLSRNGGHCGFTLRIMGEKGQKPSGISYSAEQLP